MQLMQLPAPETFAPIRVGLRTCAAHLFPLYLLLLDACRHRDGLPDSVKLGPVTEAINEGSLFALPRVLFCSRVHVAI